MSEVRKYRKKPVVIEAMRWKPGTDPMLIQSWLCLHGKTAWLEHFEGVDVLSIPTLEGEMKAQPGDWIIKGVKGEFYPIKPDIFGATYDLVGYEETGP